MAWRNPFYCNRRVALLERARFVHRAALRLVWWGRRDAAVHQFRWRDELLAELRAITPRRTRRV